jgi:hypothetical protein
MLKKVANNQIRTIGIVLTALAFTLPMVFSSAGQTSEIFERG